MEIGTSQSRLWCSIDPSFGDPLFGCSSGSCAVRLKKFADAGIKVYAISYHDQEVLAAFGEKQNITYKLFSDIDWAMIESYGIRNHQLASKDGFFYGIPIWASM